MEKHMNTLNSESMKVGLKIHKGKTKYMTNYADNEDIFFRAGWSCFGKNKEILQDKQLLISLKKQVMDQCILPKKT